MLGEGSFGTTYRGAWRGADCAVKVVRISKPDEANSFLREVEALSLLRHPHIMPFFGAPPTPQWPPFSALAVAGPQQQCAQRVTVQCAQASVWRCCHTPPACHSCISDLAHLHSKRSIGTLPVNHERSILPTCRRDAAAAGAVLAAVRVHAGGHAVAVAVRRARGPEV